ncbi:hypothetical protein WMY93_022965 [Mugilogobius chulae]|uniref:Uncharacterized protein n=1 Tax=Mugilogobius chulae TaxID=88201 RepID=A0AAW0NF30_9GOBI
MLVDQRKSNRRRDTPNHACRNKYRSRKDGRTRLASNHKQKLDRMQQRDRTHTIHTRCLRNSRERDAHSGAPPRLSRAADSRTAPPMRHQIAKYVGSREDATPVRPLAVRCSREDAHRLRPIAVRLQQTETRTGSPRMSSLSTKTPKNEQTVDESNHIVSQKRHTTHHDRQHPRFVLQTREDAHRMTLQSPVHCSRTDGTTRQSNNPSLQHTRGRTKDMRPTSTTVTVQNSQPDRGRTPCANQPNTRMYR